ncbi:MAG TPA: copper transporter [Acidimicrobiia bacterium]|nr:copper transporter [Acidimicrobiia bacterium]
MINFRFHIVSLIAVFLALALGVVMGATVVNRAIVDRLNDRIDTVESNANRRKAESDQLRSEVGQLHSYIDSAKDFAVTGRLNGVTVATIATRGVDGDAVKQTVQLAQRAGAQDVGILWLEEKFTLGDNEALRQLGDALGVPADNAKATRDAAWSALATRLAGGGSGGNSDVLNALENAGFVKFETVGDQAGENFSLTTFPGSGARVLLIDGTNGRVAANDVLAPLTNALVVNRVRVVAAELFDEKDGGPDRGSMLSPIRKNDDLTQNVSTVDDLDLTEGHVSAVLALADLGRNVVGQYGFGAGAQKSIPAWSSP